MELRVFTVALYALSVVTCQNADTHSDVIPGQYLVYFDRSITQEKVASVLSKYQVQHLTKSTSRVIALVRANAEEIGRLSSDPSIHMIEQDKIVKAAGMAEPQPGKTYSTGKPSLPSYSEYDTVGGVCQEQRADDIWHLIRTSHDSSPNYNTDAYRYEHEGEGVDIYIVSSGIDIDHAEFEGNATVGYTDPDIYVLEGHSDLFGSGTYIASLVGGVHWGVAKQANLIAVKTFNQDGLGTFSGTISALDWIIREHNSKSRDGQIPRTITLINIGIDNSEVFRDIITDVFDAGIVIIAPAGNSPVDAKLIYPGAYPNVISVGATTMSDNFAESSSWGCTVALHAPGESVSAAWSTDTTYCRSTFPGDANCFWEGSGTTGSAAIVAGIAARYMSNSSMSDSEFQSLMPDKMLEILTATAIRDRITFNNPDQQETTTNRIVHKTCGNLDWNPADAYVPCIPIPDNTAATRRSSGAGIIMTVSLLMVLRVYM